MLMKTSHRPGFVLSGLWPSIPAGCLMMCLSIGASADDQSTPGPQRSELCVVEEQKTATEARPADDGFQLLFDGKSLDGWEGDRSVFRMEDQAIVGGNMKERIPHNFFLATTRRFADFELQLEFRLKGAGTNAGVQLRSERIPMHHEMIGYQADLGQNYWGCLYDESRRNKVLARPEAAALDRVLKKEDWNSYRIRCEGKRIQLWINDFRTVDYTEEDGAISQQGHIALQMHGGPPGEVWYRHIRVKELR
jgi:hypothetical protein